MTDKVCVVAGVGQGTGLALCRRFASEGYRVAMIARHADRLAEFEKEVPGSRSYPIDMSDRDAVFRTFDAIEEELGPTNVLLHNGAAGAFTNFMETDPEVFEANFRVNAMSLLHCGQAAVPQIRRRGGGAIVVTGNTAAWRGKANYAAFAPTKAAQRILAQSAARLLGPEGIHVAYVVVDAAIDMPFARGLFPDRPDHEFAKPDAIADTIYHLAHQDRSAWTFEVDLRPFGETW